MDKKKKLMIAGGVIGVLVAVVLYLNFSGSTPPKIEGFDDYAKSSAEGASENPPPPSSEDGGARWSKARAKAGGAAVPVPPPK